MGQPVVSHAHLVENSATPNSQKPVGPLSDGATSDEILVEGEDYRGDRIDDSYFTEIRISEQRLDGIQPDVSQFIDILERDRLLIVAGPLADKVSLVRQCGWEMAERLQAHQGPFDEVAVVKALQHRPSSNEEDLFLYMDNIENPTVFILPYTDPTAINRNLVGLLETIKDRHWVVLATDDSRETWKLDKTLAGSWVEPNERSLYHLGDLKAELLHRVTNPAFVMLPENWRENSKLGELAEMLGSPRVISAFERGLLAYSAPVSDQTVLSLIDDAKSDSISVRKWFYFNLNSQEQSIAIALALFEGVEEDVAFAAVELLMEGAWRRRDRELRFVDYGDLEKLRSYFSFDEDGGEQARLRAIGHDTPRHILKTAWSTHRRQIISAVPELVNLVIESIEGTELAVPVADRSKRLSFLRDAIARSLGEIALLSFDAVEADLLRLVVSGRKDAQLTLAQTLKRVRADGDEEQLFKLLSGWRTTFELHRVLDAITQNKKGYDRNQLIGASIATILGQLAAVDAPNDLHPDVIGLARAYSSSGDVVIVQALAHSAIPAFAYLHTDQLIDLAPDFLERVGGQRDLAELMTVGIGFGFSRAIRSGRSDLNSVLLDWIAKGLARSGSEIDEKVIGPAEKRMAVAVYAFGFTRELTRSDKPESAETMSSTDAMGHLLNVLRKESHPFVRAATIASINTITRSEYDEVSVALGPVLQQITPKERAALIATMVDLHCQQRSEQNGGDSTIQVMNYSCPVWYSRDPENTAIENTAFDWSNSGGSKELSSFGFEVTAAIRQVIGRSEEKKRKELERQREQIDYRKKELKERGGLAVNKYSVELSGFQKAVIIPIANRGAARFDAVAGALASVVNKPAQEQLETLDRYRREGGKSSKLADAVERAIWWNRNFAGVAIGMTSMLGALVLFWANAG